jgi:hypothetical protein
LQSSPIIIQNTLRNSWKCELEAESNEHLVDYILVQLFLRDVAPVYLVPLAICRQLRNFVTYLGEDVQFLWQYTSECVFSYLFCSHKHRYAFRFTPESLQQIRRIVYSPVKNLLCCIQFSMQQLQLNLYTSKGTLYRSSTIHFINLNDVHALRVHANF